MHMCAGILFICGVVAVTFSQPTHVGWDGDDQNDNWPSNHILLEMMETDRGEYRDITRTLRDDLNNANNANKALSNDLANAINTIKALSNDMENLKKENEKFNETLRKAVAKMEGSDEQLVAFSMYLSEGYLRPTSGDYMILPFDLTHTNTGGHFSSTTHQFTCPVTGHYYFSYSVYSDLIHKQGLDPRHETYARLVKDDALINSVYCATYTDQFIRCQPSNSAIVLCHQNSLVYINTVGSGTQIYGGTLTTFSGFLMKAV